MIKVTDTIRCAKRMNSAYHIEKEPEKWLAEINGAIGAFGDRTNCNETILKSFVREAPERAALINGIDDTDIIEEMEGHAWRNLEIDLSNGGKLKENFSIIFALCYLDALVGINFITERMSEEIMTAISPFLDQPKHNQSGDDNSE
jgi:hypothetical protein